jgi:magnesium-transporting ATPase (P-type)
MEKLNALGGVTGLAKVIASHEHTGLDPEAKEGSPASVAEHSRVFGPNKYKEVPSKNFFALCWENLQDPIILLLIAAALVRAAAAVGHRGGGSQRPAGPRRAQPPG